MHPNKQQPVIEAVGLVMSKPKDDIYQDNMWKLSLCVRPLPHPNTGLPKHVSLIKQLLKHKEPWISPVSHFKTYRIIRKNLSWQNSSWLTLASRPSLFSSSVCCHHSNYEAPNTGTGRHFLMDLGYHWNIIMNAVMPLPFLLSVVPQRIRP